MDADKVLEDLEELDYPEEPGKEDLMNEITSYLEDIEVTFLESIGQGRKADYEARYDLGESILKIFMDYESGYNPDLVEDYWFSTEKK
ncbi:MAG: hypothetical protein ABEI78_00180 [Candidatus Nanohaloarchaea archaeon]